MTTVDIQDRALELYVGLKHQAVNEIQKMEEAEGHLKSLRSRVARLDDEIIAVAARVKQSGEHTLRWAEHALIPQHARDMLAANYVPPLPEPGVSAEAIAQASGADLV